MLQERTCAVTSLLFFSLKSSIWLRDLEHDLDSDGSVIIIWFDNAIGCLWHTVNYKVVIRIGN